MSVSTLRLVPATPEAPSALSNVDEAARTAKLVSDLKNHQLELEAQNLQLREAQRQIEESHQRYMDLYDFSPFGHISIDRWAMIHQINLTGASILGVDRSELTGVPLTCRLKGQEIRKLLDHLIRCRGASSGNQICSTFEIVTPQGMKRIIELTSMVGPEGDLIYRSTFRDITQQALTEALLEEQRQRLVQSAKMAALGEMAGGIAHEINNPLTVIHGFAQRMVYLCNAEELDRAAFQKIADKTISTSLRIARIIKGLKAFARETDEDPFERTRLDSILEDTLEFCKQRFSYHNIELSISVPENIELDCRPTEISQVLLNLLGNAFDVVESLDEKWVRIEGTKTEGWFELRVTDSGPGIPPAIQDRILDPFFTTKPVGKGVGLGLSISLGLLQRHGGTLTLDTACAHTCFVIRLPA